MRGQFSMSADPRRRARSRYLFWILAVIISGLIVRSGLFPRDSFPVKYGGDALWALVIFLCWGWVLPSASTPQVGILAVGASWVVEFMQLYHAPWIDGIRATPIGRLILGQAFNPPDLLAYVVGVVLGAAAEHLKDVWASLKETRAAPSAATHRRPTPAMESKPRSDDR